MGARGLKAPYRLARLSNGHAGRADMLRGFVLGVVVALIGVGLIAFGLISTGEIPINADAKPGGFELWAANTDLTAALKRMAPKTANPVALTDANLIEGVQLYGRHCALCHGTSAGDAARSPIAMGEYPRPPQFATDGVEDDP